MPRAAVALTGGLVVLLALGACGGEPDRVGPATTAQVQVPPVLGGLQASPEPQAARRLQEVARRSRSYVDRGWVYTLRHDGELRGLLEIIRLTADARPQDREWRRRVVGDIGSRIQRPKRVGDALVYEGTLPGGPVWIWFRDGFLYVLSLRVEETVAGEGLGFDPAAVLQEAAALRPVRP